MPPVPMSDERRLYLSLRRLFSSMIKKAENGDLSGDAMKERARQFMESEEVDRYLRTTVSKMAKSIRIETARNWREAARKGTNGRLIYESLKHEMDGPVGRRVWEIIADNVAFIKTVPQEWANYVVQFAAREAMKGNRPEEVEAKLRKVIPQHMAKNLKCIARTECAKANAAIVQARAEAVGIKCYFWRSIHDNRVRDSHWDMDKILIFYDDPPNPEELFPYPRNKAGEPVKPYGNYHAGNTFNCRCYQEVVVDVRFLPDTFKYHRHGAIYHTTRAEFLRKFGNIA